MLNTKVSGSSFVQSLGIAALVMAVAATVPTAAEPGHSSASASSSGEVAPGPVVLAPNHPERYVVVKGDTLWDISQRFLRDPWLWPEVWYVNPQIANPHLIYPGDAINLVYVNGHPQLRLERGGSNKLSPTVRELPLETAIPTIPIDAIRQFLTRSRIVSEDELDHAPYIVQSADEHLITGAGDRVYARGGLDRARYSVVRPGVEYRDPQTGESLGYEGIFVADSALQRHGDPATLLLTKSSREAVIGDRLLPVAEEEINQNFFPHAPPTPVHGRIIAVLDGVRQIGQFQVVVLNKGAREGMDAGTVLAVDQTGEDVRIRCGVGRSSCPTSTRAS